MAAADCGRRALVDRHFTGRLSPAEEAGMRGHMPECVDCRQRYERHLLYQRLTGAGRPAAARIRAGLDFAAAGGGRATWPRWSLAGAAAAGALLLLVAVTRRPVHDGVDNGEAEFAARGARPVALHSQVEVYKVHAGEPPTLAHGRIAAADELAFAYRNPRGFSHLLLFGVDENHIVYWFHPAWTDPQRPPSAIAIAAGIGPRELGEAVRHDLRGRTLRVIGLFTNAPVSVTTVEDQVRRGAALLPGSERSETVLEVVP